MGSTRLPGKSLLDLAGAPLVGRILERVKRCETVSEIVLATPDARSDDPLAALAGTYGVRLFRGSENDLVDRFYRCATECRADVVLRLPGDNPVPEPREIDRLVRFHLSGDATFSSNITHFMGNGYPDGIGIEAFDSEALEEIWRSEKDPLKREHVAANFIDYASGRPANPARYTVRTPLCPAEYRRPDLTLDVNTAEEYLYMKSLYEYLYPNNPVFGIEDIITWHDSITKRGDASRSVAQTALGADDES
jgi:spore coat polysaccharide biosynthesis protein SpsF